MKRLTFETVHNDTFISCFRFELWFLLCLFIGALPAAFTNGVDSGLIFTLFVAQRSAVVRSVSIFLPLGITFLAGYFNCKGLLLLSIFCKASLFSYSAFLVGSAAPNAGWLIAGLLLFGDWLSLVAYHQLWLQCFMRQLKIKSVFYFVISFVLFVIFLCEYFILQPFAESLFINL